MVHLLLDLKKFLRNYNVKHLLTTAHHPQTNGKVERVNQSLVTKLKCKVNSSSTKVPWTKLLESVTNEFYLTPHSITKYPPAYLLLGTLPYNSPIGQNSYYEPVNEARNLTLQRTIDYHSRNKIRYDECFVDKKFNPGDRVVYEEFHYPNTRKLSLPFSGTYEIIKESSESEVVLHRIFPTVTPVVTKVLAAVRTLDRFGISDPAGAAIVSAALQDVGNISESNVLNVVDRNKIRRGRTKARTPLLSQVIKDYDHDQFGLYFDGRKDRTLSMEDNRRKVIIEEHLHANELPIRHLFAHVDRTITGPRGLTGEIRKSLAGCEKLPVVSSTPIENTLCEVTNKEDLNKIEEFYDISTHAGPETSQRYVNFISQLINTEDPVNTFEFWILWKETFCQWPEERRKGVIEAYACYEAALSRIEEKDFRTQSRIEDYT
ncbi:hypothetical protein AVEN_84124-1 [Araneus ventricosus]|uniref:Integrase catalytic domain-containing protein n=1 Tax=Araneus ventricosus TaxID=182803 RepID=A0A4Y2PD75_ARAVE|nr:hypothetical protein AVEN_84124-1 [Araneus ventricosus]